MTTDWIGASLKDIPTPALIVDLDLMDLNLEVMNQFIAGSTANLRPHAKTHKSPAIAQKQMEAGAHGICCAKLAEAEVMAVAGVSDIFITSPVTTPAKIGRLAELARTTRLAVVADDAGNVRAIGETARDMDVQLEIVIEIDVGQRRCGVSDRDALTSLLSAFDTQQHLRLRGLQGYQGKLQMVRSYRERHQGAKKALETLLTFADIARAHHGPLDVLTGGGTGTLPIDLTMGGLNELQPGSFVFMDHRYAGIEWTPAGASVPFVTALSVLAGVISAPARDRIIVDAGWKALSCDGGLPAGPSEWPNASFAFAGDEHGVLDFAGTASPLGIGDSVRLYPSHCDTTVNLYDAYFGIRRDVVEDIWPVAARGKTQ